MISRTVADVFASLALAAALLAAPAVINLHPGAQTSVSISGAQGALSATSANGLVTVSADAQPQTIDVLASSATGTDTIHVTDAAGDAVDIPVRVAQDAGTFPSQVNLTITGSPIEWPWLWTQIEAALTRAATIQPGATLTAATPSPSPLPSPPLPNTSIGLDVPVTISGPQFYGASGVTHVTVSNAAVQPVAPPLLLYDDDPEKVDANGVIYRAPVTSAQAVRLYYYHEDTGDPRRLVVLLRSDTGATVQIIDATSGPNIDVFSVGTAVSARAIEMTTHNQGIVLTLQPGQFTVVEDVSMTARQVVAGSMQVQVLHGGPAQVEVLGVAPDAQIAGAIDGPLLPRDGYHRQGTFSIANFGAVSLAYTVGGPDAVYEYGSRSATPSNVNPASNGTDYGNYGVIQTLLFSLTNPSAAPATVYLFERPLGGDVVSSFFVDGALQRVGCVTDQHQRYEISAFQLAPGGRYQLIVQSMTGGGSSYPIEVGLTSTAPEPSAPPITAPNGCFPKPQP